MEEERERVRKELEEARNKQLQNKDQSLHQSKIGADQEISGDPDIETTEETSSFLKKKNRRKLLERREKKNKKKVRKFKVGLLFDHLVQQLLDGLYQQDARYWRDLFRDPPEYWVLQ